MRTAIDSSALLAIFGDESDGAAWLEVLMRARRECPLVVCDVVFAEIAPAFPTEAQLRAALGKLGVQHEPISQAAAWRAGMTFRSYREAGGPREHLIPDFLIAAHAQVQADRLVSADRGYFRHYFAELTLLQP
jgi:predicted nucleic acid-binding protein